MLFFIYVSIFLGLSAMRYYDLRGGKVSQKKVTPDGYTYWQQASKNGQVTRFALEVPDTVNFIVHKERSRDRFFKMLGIAQELQTGHYQFDNHYYIVTDDPDDLRSVFAAREVLDGIGRLFDTCAKRLQVHRGRLIVTLNPKKASAFGAHGVTEAMEALKPLVQGLEKTYLPLTRRKVSWLALMAMAIHSGLLMFAIPAWFIDAMDGYEILDPYWSSAVYYGAAIAFLWLALLVLTFRGTAWMSWVGFDFLVIGVAGIILSSGFFVESYNISSDFSKPAIEKTYLVSKTCELKCTSGSGKRRRSTTYDLTAEQCLAANRANVKAEYRQRYSRCRSSAGFHYDFYFENPVKAGGKPVNKSVRSAEYDKAKDGQDALMPVQPGGAGYRWVDTDKIALD